jgi:4-amino-4-deoxy-L-arabinose transferase-like glycosyltransferase
VQDAPLPAARERQLLLLCLLAGFAFRLARWLRAAAIFNDGPVFLALAQRAESGRFETLLQHPFHPLYPLAIAAVHLLGAPLGLSREDAAALVSVVAGTGAVLALYAFVRRAFGPREALVAAFLLAFHSDAVENSSNVQSEGLYMVAFIGAVGALWRTLEGGRLRAALAAGAFAGLAYLTRPEGLGVACVGLALLAGYALLGWLPPRRAAALGTALAAATAVFVLPYASALSLESGQLLLTRKKSVSWVIGATDRGGPGGLATGQAGMEAPKVRQRTREAASEEPVASARGAARPAPPDTPESDPDESLVPPPWRARAAGAALGDLVKSAYQSVRPEDLLLLLVGLFALRGRPGHRGVFLAAVIGAYGLLLFALAANVGYLSRRHTLQPATLLLGYAAVGALQLGVWLGGRRAADAAARRRGARRATALLLAVVALVSLGKSLRKPEAVEALAERRAAEWLRDRDPGSVVAARKRRVAYYAGAAFVQLRPKTPSAFEHYFDDHAVRYVVVNVADVAEYVGLAPLVGVRLEELERVKAPGGVAVVYAYHPAEAEGADGG